MIIEKYIDYFHDGGLINIEHGKDEIIFSIESSEMDLSDLKDDIELSKRNTIRGKLHVKGIKSIQINDVPFNGVLKMPYDNGEILDFDIIGTRIELGILWTNFPPKPSVNDYSMFVIMATEITWENIPDLFNPFW